MSTKGKVHGYTPAAWNSWSRTDRDCSIFVRIFVFNAVNQRLLDRGGQQRLPGILILENAGENIVFFLDLEREKIDFSISSRKTILIERYSHSGIEHFYVHPNFKYISS